VKKITRSSRQAYNVHTANDVIEFDVVVLATPFETSGIAVDAVIASQVPARTMHITHATFSSVT